MPLLPPAFEVSSVPEHRLTTYPEPFRSIVDKRVKRKLGDKAGLTHFGVNHVTLAPGGTSSLRHWHTLEDELVVVLRGQLVLKTDCGEQILSAGMFAGFPAGKRDAHQFVNRSTEPAEYLEIGDREPGDTAFYPDDDMLWIPSEDGLVAAHKDGRRYQRAFNSP